ncbi:hypothetical protein Tco_0910334 [Tanacetum coccineum]|uniref:Uncharacterized protein n=1 Tax=Tanacetum coccineum TaxID=301880 RepID=A0ABQ5CYW7_9ASTR
MVLKVLHDHNRLKSLIKNNKPKRWCVYRVGIRMQKEKERKKSFDVFLLDVVIEGAFRGVGDEEVVVGEGMVVISSSLDMLINNYVGGIMESLIFLEGLDEEALVEFMVEWCGEDEDGHRNKEDDLFN